MAEDPCPPNFHPHTYRDTAGTVILSHGPQAAVFALGYFSNFLNFHSFAHTHWSSAWLHTTVANSHTLTVALYNKDRTKDMEDFRTHSCTFQIFKELSSIKLHCLGIDNTAAALIHRGPGTAAGQAIQWGITLLNIHTELRGRGRTLALRNKNYGMELHWLAIRWWSGRGCPGPRLDWTEVIRSGPSRFVVGNELTLWRRSPTTQPSHQNILGRPRRRKGARAQVREWGSLRTLWTVSEILQCCSKRNFVEIVVIRSVHSKRWWSCAGEEDLQTEQTAAIIQSMCDQSTLDRYSLPLLSFYSPKPWWGNPCVDLVGNWTSTSLTWADYIRRWTDNLVAPVNPSVRDSD